MRTPSRLNAPDNIHTKYVTELTSQSTSRLLKNSPVSSYII